MGPGGSSPGWCAADWSDGADSGLGAISGVQRSAAASVAGVLGVGVQGAKRSVAK